jgi:hypothetical protein
MTLGNNFEAAFARIIKTISFDKEWFVKDYETNATELVLPAGDLFKSLDSKDRKMIFVGLGFGSVVVFQRYTHDSSLICKSVPKVLSDLFQPIFRSGPIQDLYELINLIGTPASNSVNIGHRIKALYDAYDAEQPAGPDIDR